MGSLASIATANSLHGLIERLAVGDVYQVAATFEGWQGRKRQGLRLLLQETAQGRLDQLSHRAATAGRFLFQKTHDGGSMFSVVFIRLSYRPYRRYWPFVKPVRELSPTSGRSPGSDQEAEGA